MTSWVKTFKRPPNACFLQNVVATAWEKGCATKKRGTRVLHMVLRLFVDTSSPACATATLDLAKHALNRGPYRASQYRRCFTNCSAYAHGVLAFTQPCSPSHTRLRPL
jgi:hypothetical protein